MLIVFTGNGKGKTTASLGQAVRMVGRGKRVLMIQFIKGPWKSGEDFVTLLQRVTADSRACPSEAGRRRGLNPSTSLRVNADQRGKDEGSKGHFELRKRGKGFVGILGDELPREDHVEAARAALAEATSEMRQGNWDCIILDEINVATSLGLLTKDEVLDAVRDLPAHRFVIFSGRGAPQEFIDRADLVTEMREVKHPFNDGKMAEIAVEF